MLQTNEWWVDCFSDKFLYIFPNIKEYLFFLNRWSFKLTFEADTIVSDITEYYSKLYDRLGVQEEEYTISHATQIRKFPALLQCDLFDLPYSNKYQTQHMPHYVWVEKHLSDDHLYISDDSPNFCGSIDFFTLLGDKKEMTVANLHLDLSREKEEEPIYLAKLFSGQIYSNEKFVSDIINCDFSETEKCLLISDNAILFSGYRSIIRFCRALFEEVKNTDILEITKVAIEYCNEWKLISMMCQKGIYINNKTMWSRIEERLERILLLEEGLKREMMKLHAIILDLKRGAFNAN